MAVATDREYGLFIGGELTEPASGEMRELHEPATGEPLARALVKIESYAKQVPMDIDPAHASAFIVNPLTGRKMQFANLFRSHPPTEDRVERLRSREWEQGF